jgi:hypothetical protein
MDDPAEWKKAGTGDNLRKGNGLHTNGDMSRYTEGADYVFTE